MSGGRIIIGVPDNEYKCSNPVAAQVVGTPTSLMNYLVAGHRPVSIASDLSSGRVGNVTIEVTRNTSCIVPNVQQSNIGPLDVVTKCVMCNEEHATETCNAFLHLKRHECTRRIMLAKLCRLCLYPGHQYLTCSAPVCSNCNERHHIVLCRQ